MSLTEYKRKRHFRRTPEPAGQVVRKPSWSYVIQKHAASHLHYDFRLELEGVLKSWAVPKGPSLNPSVKRLAMQVEDHPVEYGSFEGIIPEGEYGGGTVMLWDRGTWEPVGDARQGIREGKLKFLLHGEKLTGRWMLVRKKQADSGRSIPWLLFKKRDDAARDAKEEDILEESPLSIASGRDLAGIAAAKDQVWSSHPKGSHKRAKTSPSKRKTRAKKARRSSKASAIPAAVEQSLPSRIEVQLATLAKDPPEGKSWLHEIKYDGYRMICRVDCDQVKFISRNHQDWTARLKPLVPAVHQLPVKQAILDGEVVAMRQDGRTDFQTLQNAFRDRRAEELQYIVFDLLYLDGLSLSNVPLEERKHLLAELLSAISAKSALRYSDHIDGSGPQFQQQACRLELEGIVSKRRDQPYRPGRGTDWLKIKCLHKEEFVIGGFTEPSGSRVGFGALLLGSYDTNQKLHYTGKVGAGFDDRELRDIHQRLKSLEQPHSPFIDRTRKVGEIRTAHWVAPSVVAQITFGSRSREGILRHAVYSGLRKDKSAEDVQLDYAMPIEKAQPKSKAARFKSAPAKSAAKSQRTSKQTQPRAAAGESDYDDDQEMFAGVRLTSGDKLLYPDEGITKLEIARYYRDIQDWILPHIAHRPLVLVRCPEGRQKECFYQKHPGVGTPANLRQIPIRESKRTENYVVVDDVAGLISLAQIGTLEIHAWGSREDKPEQPDRLIFDLDPAPDVEWKRVVDSARQIKEFLEELGLESFVKTTGGKGLHLVVPIDRRHDWDEAKAFCKQVADTIVAAAPNQYTANMSKAARHGKIFLDYLRNGRGATAVVPYSTRSRPGATVSTPLTWKELSPRIKSEQFTVRNLRQRLARLARDPWEGIEDLRQSLSGPIKTLRTLSAVP